MDVVDSLKPDFMAQFIINEKLIESTCVHCAYFYSKIEQLPCNPVT